MRGILKRIKGLIQENRENQNKIILQNQELEWALVYHDSIRGIKYLEKLPLNIGRWAGNYSFFYVLNRILNDFKPKSILEFGLGESTKFISAFLDNNLIESKHIVIEQDENWKAQFVQSFNLSKQTDIVLCPLIKVKIKGMETNAYLNLDLAITDKFDFYIIDGPFGSLHYSRYDIINIAKDFNSEDQFIIIIDDYDRPGEKETVVDLLGLLKQKKIKTYNNTYTGNKSVMVIATEKYQLATSL